MRTRVICILKPCVRVLFSIFFLLSIIVVFPKTAEATIDCSVVILNRCLKEHYHRGGDAGDSGWEQVYPPVSSGDHDLGLPANDATQFDQIIWGRLFMPINNDADYEITIGAAFLVNTMLGHWGTDFGSTDAGINNARARYPEWQQRMYYAASLGEINFGARVTYGAGIINTALNPRDNDTLFYEMGHAETRWSIVFNGRADLGRNYQFHIKKNCANPIGYFDALPAAGNYDLTPGIYKTVDSAVRGQSVTFNYTVANAGNGDSILSDGSGVNYAIFDNFALLSNGQIIVPARSTNNYSINAVVPVAMPVGSEYCLYLHVDPSAGATRGAVTRGLYQPVPSACIRIVDKPFVHVNNGDVWSGMLFGDSDASNCNGNANGEIKSWVYSISGSSRGARGEHALTALGDINDFGSRNDPYNNFLKFANTPSNGRFLGNSIPPDQECIPDYYEKFASVATGTIEINQPNDPDLENSGNGIFFVTHPGDNGIKLDGSGPAYNKKQVLLVEGNVFINGDIQFDTNIASTENLPYLFIVARGGNITIAENVTRIDAVLISIPRDTNSDGTPEGGLIDTCVNGAGAKYTQLSTSICDQHLDINGSLIAKEVLFKRTYVNNPGDYQPAESINFPPGLFLSNPFDDHLSPEKQLGEVRQILDLPPVY